MTSRSLVLIATLATLGAAAPTALAADPGPYRGSGDAGGFRDVLPPGNGTSGTVLQPTDPPHIEDQLPLYRDIIPARGGLTGGMLDRFFKEESFGARTAERTVRPRGDVVIVWDEWGVPHITGDTTEGMAFGAGYAVATDRLFFMDVVRHAGKGQLSSFIGLDKSNLEMDAEQRRLAGYSEDELQQQVDLFPTRYGAQGAQIKRMAEAYVAGINARIAEVRTNPTLLPPEYPGLQLTLEDYRPGDLVAIASLVGGILGAGGGSEVENAAFLRALQKRFGPKAGYRAFLDFRRRNDPEAPTTSPRRAPYLTATTGPRGRGVVVPTGQFRPASEPQMSGGATVADLVRRAGTGRAFVDLSWLAQALRRGHVGASNALLVTRGRSRSGRPLAVFGPQVSYWAPEILYEEELQAPGISTRGVSFIGTNLVVELGRGTDYAWSATSMNGDNVDSFVNDLCSLDGSKATIESDGYVYKGNCRAITRRTETEQTKPNAQYPEGGSALTWTMERTVHGPVIGRTLVGDRPVIVSHRRSTFFAEADSIRGFLDFMTPARMRSPAAFYRAADKIFYTFNWFFVNRRDIAYFGAGRYPRRAPGTDPDLPTNGQGGFDWRGYDRGIALNPRATNPKSGRLTSWNNKPAPGWAAADDTYGYGPVYRSLSLDEGIARELRRGRGKMDLAGLVRAMAVAATVDLRGSQVVPEFLRILGRPTDAGQREAVAILRAWTRSGAHRVDLNGDGRYDAAAAVALADELWPRIWRGVFGPVVGTAALAEFPHGIDDHPTQHLGSAWNGAPYGQVTKDWRQVRGARVRGRLSRSYCGGGKLTRCRAAMRRVLGAAIAALRARFGGGSSTWSVDPRQDDIVFRAIGLQTVPDIPWQNRPTFQQAVEVGVPVAAPATPPAGGR